MGCDIHSYAEYKDEQGKWHCIEGLEPFHWRSYTNFAFLAGVRNNDGLKPISVPRGLPEDCSDKVREASDAWEGDGHTHSWLSMQELIEFDYAAIVQYGERPNTLRGIFLENLFKAHPELKDKWNAAQSAALDEEEGSDKPLTYLEFFHESFFEELSRLSKTPAQRIVFWFDN